MRQILPLAILAVVLTACSSQASGGTATTTPQKTSPARSTTSPHTGATAPAASLRPSSTPGALPTTRPTAIAVSAGYSAFVHTLCSDLAQGNGSGVINLLPYYQYNSGLRWGMLGDGEGQTVDPSLLNTWLQGSHVRCQQYSPDNQGHGTILTSGWAVNGGSSLIDVDTFNGVWKINDFTFGSQAALAYAMQTARPILPYRT